MNSDYLSKNSDCISFSDRQQFDNIITNLDLAVPNRDKGGKSFHRERVSAIRYLKAAVHFSQIDFPFSIQKSESPDFIIQLKTGQTIGLEHRDIADEKWQESLSQIAKQFNSQGYILGELPGSQMSRDEVDSEWARLALVAVSEKIDKLNLPHYKALDTYELLLYSNTGLPNIFQVKAIDKLSSAFDFQYKDIKFNRLFRSITIIYGDEVWYRRLFFNNC